MRYVQSLGEMTEMAASEFFCCISYFAVGFPKSVSFSPYTYMTHVAFAILLHVSGLRVLIFVAPTTTSPLVFCG